MSGLLQFPLQTLWKTLGTGEEPRLGAITLSRALELRQIVCILYKKGAHVGTEQIRLNLYHDQSLTKLYATSEWFDVADIPDVSASSWRGLIPFDFDRQHWAANQKLYVSAETAGYTRTGNSFYLALRYDWPESINGNPNAIYMAVKGYR